MKMMMQYHHTGPKIHQEDRERIKFEVATKIYDGELDLEKM
jgi:hypothetical protein